MNLNELETNFYGNYEIIQNQEDFMKQMILNL